MCAEMQRTSCCTMLLVNMLVYAMWFSGKLHWKGKDGGWWSIPRHKIQEKEGLLLPLLWVGKFCCEWLERQLIGYGCFDVWFLQKVAPETNPQQAPVRSENASGSGSTPAKIISMEVDGEEVSFGAFICKARSWSLCLNVCLNWFSFSQKIINTELETNDPALSVMVKESNTLTNQQTSSVSDFSWFLCFLCQIHHLQFPVTASKCKMLVITF